MSSAVTACDVRPDGTVRLTLFRIPYYCHHDPDRMSDESMPVTDLGPHDIEVALLDDPSAADVRRESYRQTAPLTFSETTFGVQPLSLSKKTN